MIRTPLTAALGLAALATGLTVVASPASATTTPACSGSALSINASRTQGATGHSSFVLLFRNHTDRACTLTGYPGLDAITASGHVLAHARRTVRGFTGGSRHGVRTIVVRPGHYASADVEWLNFNPVTSGACRFSAAIATTPPNTMRTVHRARSVSICRLQVHPVVAGRTGQS